MPKLMRVMVLSAVSILLAAARPRAQEAYPSKPVRMIVPFPPGGPADLIARLMAQKLSEDLGKQFYIENHSGAGGNLGVGWRACAGRRLFPDRPARPRDQSQPLQVAALRSVQGPIAVTRIATTPNVARRASRRCRRRA